MDTKLFFLTLAVFCIVMPPVMYLVNYLFNFDLHPATYFITPLITAPISYFLSKRKQKN